MQVTPNVPLVLKAYRLIPKGTKIYLKNARQKHFFISMEGNAAVYVYVF